LKEEKYILLAPSEKVGLRRSDMKTTPREVKAYKAECDLQLEYDLTVHRWLIFKRLAMGYSVKEIAADLHSTPESITAQKSTIKDQLEIRGNSDVGFLLKALEMGIVEVRTFLEKETGITIMD
ncbi:MAG: hypothetical protein AAGJ18_25690, partial [Bacteroidota bacterium]